MRCVAMWRSRRHVAQHRHAPGSCMYRNLTTRQRSAMRRYILHSVKIPKGKTNLVRQLRSATTTTRSFSFHYANLTRGLTSICFCCRFAVSRFSLAAQSDIQRPPELLAPFKSDRFDLKTACRHRGKKLISHVRNLKSVPPGNGPNTAVADGSRSSKHTVRYLFIYLFLCDTRFVRWGVFFVLFFAPFLSKVPIFLKLTG